MRKAHEKGGHWMNLRRSMTKAWPVLPYLAYGVWLAWITLGISGTVWLSDVETNGEHITHFYIVLCISCGVTCLVAAFFPRQAQKILDNNVSLIAVICAAVVGGIMTILLGPYYLEAYISDTYAIHTVAFVLMGIGSAAIFLKTGKLYGCLPPRKTLCYVLYSQFIMAVLCFLTLAAPDWEPVEGGPAIVGIIMFCFLPLLAAFLLVLPINKKADDVQVCTYSNKPKDLTSNFWRLMILAFLIFFVTSAMQGGAITTNSPAFTVDGTVVLIYLRVIFAIVLLLVLLVFDIQRIKFGRVYTVVSVVVVALLMITAILGSYTEITSFFICFASYVFDFAVFILMSFLVYQKRISSNIVFGFSYGICMLAVAFGWLLGASYLPIILEMDLVNLYIIGALIVLVAGVLIFSERTFDKLFSTHNDREPTFENMMQAGTPIAHLDEPQRGKFSDAISSISDEYDLSHREAGVFHYLAMGRNASFIASKLYLSRNTVRTHMHNIYMKLDVHSQQDLIDLVESRTPHRESVENAVQYSEDKNSSAD